MLSAEKYATKEPVWSFSEAFQPFSIFSFSFFQEKQQVLMYPPGPDPRCRCAAPLCQQQQSFLEVKKKTIVKHGKILDTVNSRLEDSSIKRTLIIWTEATSQAKNKLQMFD